MAWALGFAFGTLSLIVGPLLYLSAVVALIAIGLPYSIRSRFPAVFGLYCLPCYALLAALAGLLVFWAWPHQYLPPFDLTPPRSSSLAGVHAKLLGPSPSNPEVLELVSKQRWDFIQLWLTVSLAGLPLPIAAAWWLTRFAEEDGPLPQSVRHEVSNEPDEGAAGMNVPGVG